MASRNELAMLRLAAAITELPVTRARVLLRRVNANVARRIPIRTGEARAGGQVGVNAPPTFQPRPEASSYSVPDDSHVDQALAGLQLGDTVYWRNRVPHSGVLEGGRRFSPALGRMVGSEQAPDGFLGLSIEEALEELASEDGV